MSQKCILELDRDLNFEISLLTNNSMRCYYNFSA